MAKKDANVDQTDGDISVGGDPSATESRWETGEWSFYPIWRCVLCPFDTLEGEEAMLEHWHSAHEHPTETPAPSTIPIYDRRGNLKSAAN